MKRWIVLLIIAFAVSAGRAQNSSPILKAMTVIRAGVLIDGESNTPRRNQVIIVRGNQIVEVSDAATARIPAGAETKPQFSPG